MGSQGGEEGRGYGGEGHGACEDGKVVIIIIIMVLDMIQSHIWVLNEHHTIITNGSKVEVMAKPRPNGERERGDRDGE